MNKKIILISAIGIALIAIGVWYVSSHQKIPGKHPLPKISLQSEDLKTEESTSRFGEIPPKLNRVDSSGDRNDFTPVSIDLGGKDRPLSEEEMDQLEAYYERTEKNWDQKVANMFSECGLPKEAFGDYQKLRESYEEAKMDAFQEFHNKMIEKYGENYEYNPSDEQENFDEKVNSKYQDKLKTLIGAKCHPKYLEMRDQNNEKLSKEQNPELGKMVMDF